MDTGVTLTLDAVTLDNVTLSGSVDNTATLTIDPTVTLHGATIDGGTIDVTGKLLVQDGDTATIDVNTVTVEFGAIIQADCSALTISENQPGSANSGTIEATNGGTESPSTTSSRTTMTGPTRPPPPRPRVAA